MAYNKTQKQAKFLKELELVPIIGVACQRTGIARATYYRWLEVNPDFKDQTETVLERGSDVVNDMAESKLISDIKDGKPAAYKYWLSNRHPKYYSPTKSRYMDRKHPNASGFVTALVEFVKPPIGKKRG